jgi:hypothetical protein
MDLMYAAERASGVTMYTKLNKYLFGHSEVDRGDVQINREHVDCISLV